MFIQLTTSTASGITLADAKTHLRLSTTAFDSYIPGLIATAQDYCERYINGPIFTTNWYFFPDVDFDFPIVIPKGNVSDVTAFEFRDAAGTWHTIDPNVTWDSSIEAGRAKVFLRPFVVLALPVLYTESPFRVTFTAGFGADSTFVPPMIQHAMKILVSEMFQQSPGMAEVKPTVDMLLDRYRYWFMEMF